MQDQLQITDPVRFIYNVTPKTKLLQAKSSINAAVHYTPLENSQLHCLNYPPLTCSCQAVMNRYCAVDFNNKSIRCTFCGNSMQLPPNYAQHIRPEKLPYELMPANTTFEYKTTNKSQIQRYSYLFSVDISIEQKQLNSIRQQIANVISRLPDHINVGLITYSRHVYVHQFSTKISTKYCINGAKQYTTFNIMDLLGIPVNKNDPNTHSSDIIKKFLVPVDHYRSALIRRVKNIKADNKIYVNQRKESCFGQALNIAICLSEISTICTRIVHLVGNPCTIGPGLTISTNFKQQMRSPKQLSLGQNIKYFVAAKNYYDSFLKRVLNNKIILDIFIFTLNQIGFTEMSDLFIGSGGFVVMHEQFSDRIFKQSFSKIFPDKDAQTEGKIKCVTEAVIQVFCSKQVAINGALGQSHSLNKSKPFVSDKVIGKGKTNSWYLGSADKTKTLTIVYETKDVQAKQQYYYFQFKIIFKNQFGQIITRVTTVRRQWSSLNDKIIQNFDQEAAAVFVARMSINKMLYEEQKNIRQWLDQLLVKWAQNYANYIKNDESSFSLPLKMKRLPQLIYHLRRSHFVNRFGISLDQSFFKGYWLNREAIFNCLAMIQPALLSYSLNNQTTQPVPVNLDEEEMQDEVILLLDSYFVIIEWYGETVHSWQKQKYHEMQGYEHINQLFNSPKIDIDYIMQSRFPAPNYYKVHPYHSKQRYLKSRVNPKKNSGQQHQNMLTDDSDLKSFTQHLIRIVVRQA